MSAVPAAAAGVRPLEAAAQTTATAATATPARPPAEVAAAASAAATASIARAGAAAPASATRNANIATLRAEAAAAACVTVGSVQESLVTFQATVQNEIGLYELLKSNVFYSSDSAPGIRKNWMNLCNTFSQRFAQENHLLAMSDAIHANIDKLNDLRIATQFYQTLSKTVGQFKDAANKYQSEILFRFKAASQFLDPKQYPLIIQTYTPPPKKPQPSLLGRVVRGVWNHKGKFAFAASALLLASQTPYTAKLLVDGAALASQHVLAKCAAAASTATKIATNASTYLPYVGSALDAVWALPASFKAWRAGYKKTAFAVLALGAASSTAKFLQPSHVSTLIDQTTGTIAHAANAGSAAVKNAATAAGEALAVSTTTMWNAADAAGPLVSLSARATEAAKSVLSGAAHLCAAGTALWTARRATHEKHNLKSAGYMSVAASILLSYAYRLANNA